MDANELKAAVAAKNAEALAADPSADAAAGCVTDTLQRSAVLFRSGLPAGPSAAAFNWFTLVEILLPILLAWIDRRFPKPPTP